MRVIDIVKPAPRTELEVNERWKNRLHSDLAKLNRYRTKIVVKDKNSYTQEVRHLSGLLNRSVITKSEFNRQLHEINKKIWA